MSDSKKKTKEQRQIDKKLREIASKESPTRAELEYFDNNAQYPWSYYDMSDERYC